MNKTLKTIIGSIFLMAAISTAGFAQDGGLASKFSGYDNASKTRIDHEPLTEALEISVLPLGRSLQILAHEKPNMYRNSKIKTAENLSPSRYEGNRVFFHAFSDGLKDFYRGYLDGLQTLTRRRSLSTFNQDEQLAFWLNLHNVILITHLQDEYPIRDLKRVRLGKRGQGSFWSQKVVNIEGEALSLLDIEHIVMANWGRDIVVYGFWQGAIGGPNLPPEAYTGANVWQLLEKNAIEFVNSNRGAKPKGSDMVVSDFYEWVMPAFDNSSDSLMRHIKVYSDARFHGDISRQQTLRYDYFDWTISDLLGGTLHTGGHNQLGGVLSGVVRGYGDEESGGQFGAFQTFYNLVVGRNPLGPQEIIPLPMMNLLTGVAANNDYPGRTPNITTEECDPGEECPANQEF